MEKLDHFKNKDLLMFLLATLQKTFLDKYKNYFQRFLFRVI